MTVVTPSNVYRWVILFTFRKNTQNALAEKRCSFGTFCMYLHSPKTSGKKGAQTAPFFHLTAAK